MVRYPGWVAGFIAVFLFMSSGVFAGEGAVEFGDERLKAIVEKELGKKDPTAEDMLKVHEIGWPWATRKDVTNLQGLEHAKNLVQLYLESSPIQDFSVLSRMTGLEELGLYNCEISDLSPIVSAIESHDALRHLSFKGNRISDISSLLKLKSQKLRNIDLKDNPLNEDAYKIIIPQLRKNFKEIEINISFRPVQLVKPGIFFVLFVIAGVFVVIRYWQQKGWVFELISGALSAGVGCFLGVGAQLLYEVGEFLFMYRSGYENPMWVGGIVGGVLGLLAGVWFAQFLRGLHAKGKNGGAILGRGVLAGIGLGMLCSTAVHVILMMAYRNDIRPMFVGLCFGVGAGIVAGLVLVGCFVVGYKNGLIKGKETA